MTRTLIMTSATLVVALLTAGATAVRSVNRLWLRSWIERGERDDRLEPVGRFVERPKRLIVSATTGVALAVFLAGAGLALLDLGEPWRLAGDAALLALLVLTVGQLLPRAIARRWAVRLVPVFVPVLATLAIALAPFRLLARRLARGVARIIAPRTTVLTTTSPSATEGLEELLQDGTLDGLDASEELAIISGVVQLTGKTAGEVMTPRGDVFALEESLPPDEMARRIAQSGFSRVPVFRGSLDQPVGMLHAFDVLIGAERGRLALRPIGEAPVSQPAGELLYALLRARRQLAIVRAPDGTVAGLVTLEDLLEELVGEIRDEHDEPATPPGAQP
jgi:putative hemolysin